LVKETTAFTDFQAKRPKRLASCAADVFANFGIELYRGVAHTGGY
jgi:hypothetical protein